MANIVFHIKSELLTFKILYIFATKYIYDIS